MRILTFNDKDKLYFSLIFILILLLSINIYQNIKIHNKLQKTDAAVAEVNQGLEIIDRMTIQDKKLKIK